MNRNTQAIIILIVLIFLAGIFVFGRRVLPPAAEPAEYKIAVADRGSVVSSVPASGIVNPENEVLVLSPYSGLVSEIVKVPGSRVAKGDIVLTLDTKSIIQEIENLKDQLNVMENDLKKNRLSSRSIRVDLDYNMEVKNLRISSLKTELADEEQLLKVGGISPAYHEQTKEELVLAEKDLKMTMEKNSIRLTQLEADEDGMLLQIEMRKKVIKMKEDFLERMTVKAPSNGIILDVYTNVGNRVDMDQLLVKMSDLSTFKIRASIDNKMLENIKTGGDVFVVLPHERLRGKIGNISPVITDKKVYFDVFLDFSHYKELVPNLEVDLMVVTEFKDSVLRIEQGPAFNSNKQQDVYVVRDGTAAKVEITTGLIGTDYVEIKSGLEMGDKVIVSNTSTLRHKKEVDFEDM
jgi:HlyD family secretion protein